MNIIFGNAVDQISTSHTVLELDTFKLMPSEKLVTSYCVIETVPLAEFPRLEANKNIHQQLIQQYQQQDWKFCQSAVHSLMGCWNGELDSFYQHLAERIDNYVDNPPAADWDPCIIKHSD